MIEVLFILALTLITGGSFFAGYSYARITESQRRHREAKAKLKEMLGDG